VKISTALKHLFIPHEHNDYKPHFFREISVAIIVVGSIFMLGFSFGSSFLIHKTVLGASVTANVLVDLTNESRLTYNEEPLRRNPVLDKAATLKADDMAANQYFSHNSPTGVTPWHWFQEAGYTFLYAGENLAINFIDPNEVRDAWLASPTHRANLLDVRFKEIGMSTVSGVYKDGPTIYIVQLFGTPAVEKAAAAAPATTTETSALEEEPVKIAVASAPQIKGESKTNVIATTAPNATPTPALSSVVDTPELAVVKNNETVEAQSQVEYPPVKQYSAWYERFLFGGSYYVGIVFRILLGIVLVALVTMLTIEVRKQHWKHIVYGLSVLLIISLCTIINQSFW
jgi:hypothetical protein